MTIQSFEDFLKVHVLDVKCKKNMVNIAIKS